MYNKILVPIAVDHGPNTGEALSIARLLLAEGGKIMALTVVETIPPYVASSLPKELEIKSREAVRAGLKAELGDASDTEMDVVQGHAARTILKYAEEHGADCIIIASHRPGLQDYLLGSTAGRVVRHAPCAVHVVR